MSSFQQAVPKLICSNKLKIVKRDDLFLDKIPTWEDWDQPDTGFCATLKKNRTDFKEAHEEMVNMRLDSSSLVYTLAIMSATESVA